jgi:Tol biopolymer transport system component
MFTDISSEMVTAILPLYLIFTLELSPPSLSPDGMKIAFKRVVGGQGDWRLFVLDLRTMHAIRLAGDDPIDDQAECPDDDHVVYGNDNVLWEVPADRTGHPRKLLSYANSPAVSRAS